MNRDLREMARKEYDLVVIGGGIFGVCAAWDAAQRGLSVALVEKEDFSHATSANHLKMVHGGIRYLQHGDVLRIRESSRERSALLRIAPHLVAPLPVVVPTYGHGMKGKEFLAVGMAVYDLLTLDRNLGIADLERRIPRGSLLSRREVLDLFPGVERDGFTGGAVFFDGQVHNPPRLALAFLRSAVNAGADAANHLAAVRFLRDGRRVGGVEVRDALTGETFDIRGKTILNTAGPWAAPLLEEGLGIRISPPPVFSRDVCFVVRKSLSPTHALACQTRSRDADAVVSRGGRHLFVAPWRGYTLVGVWHGVHRGSPDAFGVTEAELQSFLDETNVAYPGLSLSQDDVTMVNAGLILFAENEPGTGGISFGKRSVLWDHGTMHGVEGLVTLIGVRATTARGMAEKAVDLVFRKQGRTPPRCRTETTPIHGGRIGLFGGYLGTAVRYRPEGVEEQAMCYLVHHYGCEHGEVLKYLEENPAWGGFVEGSCVMKAQVVHAVRKEMARTLSDVVFRRTDLGTAEHPGEEALTTCAEIIASELGWSAERIGQERDAVRAEFLRGRIAAYPESGGSLAGVAPESKAIVVKAGLAETGDHRRTVLITGGTGFIGSRLAAACVGMGHAVRVLGQENTPAEAGNRKFVEGKGAEVILGSVTDREILGKALDGVDTVFHLAAAQHEANVPDRRFWDVNVSGTVNLLEESERAGVKRFVHGSTIGVYGSTQDGPINEATPVRPENIYGVTKLEGEKAVLSCKGIPHVVIIRIPETYGPGDRRLLKLFRAIGKNRFFLIGDGRNLHHPIYIDDLVESLLLAAAVPEAAGNVFVVAGEKPLTTAEMAKTIAYQTGEGIPGTRLPLSAFLLLAAVMEGTLKPLGIQPPIHRRRMDFFRKSFSFSPEKAKEVLGFSPRVSFRDGVLRTAAWYREQGLLGDGGGHRPKEAVHGNEGNGKGSGTGLAARIEPFDSFWEAPKDVEKGYGTFAKFYRHNYLRHVPSDRRSRILVVSCGPGYFVNLLTGEGYSDVLGIDSDPEKVGYAREKSLNCRVERAFEFLAGARESYDCIIAEQEINHLTKEEILRFLDLCLDSLKAGGTLLVHSLNGANPITGAEALAQNFDHFNSFTEYSLRQVLEYSGFHVVKVIPLNLYVFYNNPLNYVAILLDRLNTLYFRLNFKLYGKANRIFTKKIGAVCRKIS